MNVDGGLLGKGKAEGIREQWDEYSQSMFYAYVKI
jgi:hypothetical protein